MIYHYNGNPCTNTMRYSTLKAFINVQTFMIFYHAQCFIVLLWLQVSPLYPGSQLKQSPDENLHFSS